MKKIPLAFCSLFVIAALSACSISETKPGNKQSASPTPSETVTETFDPIAAMQRGKPNLAQNALEEEFLTMALNSCQRAIEDGLVIEHADITSYFIGDPNTEFGNWRIREVAVVDGVAGPGIYNNYLPEFFAPCETLIQADLIKPEDGSQRLEHTLVKISARVYSWGEHSGGFSTEDTKYSVDAEGFISGYGETGSETKVSYGPFSETIKAYFN